MRPQRSKNPALKKKKTPAHPIATLEFCVCVCTRVKAREMDAGGG